MKDILVNSEKRKELIEQYKAGHKLIIKCLESVPAEAYDYKPGPSRWSIHETIAHITDSDINSFIRFRKAIAEPGDWVSVYDEDKWVEELNPKEIDIEVSLELFKANRIYTALLLESIDDSCWSNSIMHPDNGEMTLEDILAVYSGHVLTHTRQINKTLEAWEKSKRGEYVNPDESLVETT